MPLSQSDSPEPQKAAYTDGKRTWNTRYYATYDRPAAWYDLGELSSLQNVPDEAKLFPLTDAQWADRWKGPILRTMAVIDGAITDFVYQPPLALQAKSALENTQSQLIKRYMLLGKPIPQTWIDYQTTLMAIASGADKRSQELPKAPTDDA
ncbi:hypothetical protein [Swingsia samuiensis]|uniref:Uncharacterized protein n=1 Tax=Swingsia samuiensis TaxID=1293412 RepID=A0A4Y6UIL6_9PROT|nr:hypothetical protein [Swingsia samuiensis]QDH17392.1 hypothetical protein E3D00_07315 [Swingsia samuiensis]